MRRLTISVPLLVMALFLPVGGVSAQATCDSYASPGQAQLIFDITKAAELDPNGNGIACESSEVGQAVPLPPQNAAPSEPDTANEPASADVTDEELEYIESLSDDLELSADVSGEVGALFSEAGQDPTLIFDQDWIINLASQLALWQIIAEDAQELEPSDRQLHIQTLWLEINSLILLAIGDITFGIDNIDPTSLERGGARIVYATLLIDDLSAAIVAFGEDPNTPAVPTNAIWPVSACDEFPDFELAQLYYAAYPKEQATIDPDVDGFACEVFFGEE